MNSKTLTYKLLDTGNLCKLEQVGEYRLVRPAANAFWQPALPDKEWQNVHGIYTRNSKGSGSWEWRQGGVPESWTVEHGGTNILVKPTAFGHLGFFAEQYANWQWLRQQAAKSEEQIETLNLFAYSGGSSMAMAKGGAKVTHLDAAKGMNAWGQEILKQNPDIPNTIRWIADDVLKFVKRELRRERQYQGIVLDPPTFGRGSQGQVWKMEEHIIELLQICRQLTPRNKPFFILFSCHSPGFSPIVLGRLLQSGFGIDSSIIESGEMCVPQQDGQQLPAGAYARFSTF